MSKDSIEQGVPVVDSKLDRYLNAFRPVSLSMKEVIEGAGFTKQQQQPFIDFLNTYLGEAQKPEWITRGWGGISEWGGAARKGIFDAVERAKKFGAATTSCEEVRLLLRAGIDDIEKQLKVFIGIV